MSLDTNGFRYPVQGEVYESWHGLNSPKERNLLELFVNIITGEVVSTSTDDRYSRHGKVVEYVPWTWKWASLIELNKRNLLKGLISCKLDLCDCLHEKPSNHPSTVLYSRKRKNILDHDTAMFSTICSPKWQSSSVQLCHFHLWYSSKVDSCFAAQSRGFCYFQVVKRKAMVVN